MAAHAYTMLKEIATRPMSLEMVQHGLGYAMAGDQFDYNDWAALYHATSPDNVQEIATRLLPKYEKLWQFLGEPPTAENWQYALSILKRHHRWSKYINLLFEKVQA